MKLLKPVKNVPNSGVRHSGKYADIYRAVKQMPNGDWLPVQFDERKQAYNFYLTAKTHRTLRFEVKTRLNVVYLRMAQ